MNDRSGMERFSLRGARTGKARDKPAFAHTAIANAAFACSCRTLVVAVQRKSPKQSFHGVDLGQMVC
jgi:hypothetical protein